MWKVLTKTKIQRNWRICSSFKTLFLANDYMYQILKRNPYGNYMVASTIEIKMFKIKVKEV